MDAAVFWRCLQADPMGPASPVGLGKWAMFEEVWKKIGSVRFELTPFYCVAIHPLDVEQLAENTDQRTLAQVHVAHRYFKSLDLHLKVLLCGWGLEICRQHHVAGELQVDTCPISIACSGGDMWEMRIFFTCRLWPTLPPPPLNGRCFWTVPATSCTLRDFGRASMGNFVANAVASSHHYHEFVVKMAKSDICMDYMHWVKHGICTSNLKAFLMR